MDAQLSHEIDRLHHGLDALTYYDFLGLHPHADYLAVRDAFYARSQTFHPDRFVALDDEDIKARVYAIYKRMTEAYNVLADPVARFDYDRGREGGAVRLSELARARRLSADERQVNNAFARIYLRSGRSKLERNQLVGAWIDCRLGLSIEEAGPLLALRGAIASHVDAARLLGGSV